MRVLVAILTLGVCSIVALISASAGPEQTEATAPEQTAATGPEQTPRARAGANARMGAPEGTVLPTSAMSSLHLEDHPPPQLGESFQIGGAPVYGPVLGYQSWPSMAFDGTNFLIVWEDNRRGTSDIYGARVDRTGELGDPYGIFIGSKGNTPSVSYDGASYMVAWEQSPNIFAARVDPSGTVLDPGGILVSSSNSAKCRTAICFDGVNHLVLWEDNLSGFFNQDIYGARVSASW